MEENRPATDFLHEMAGRKKIPWILFQGLCRVKFLVTCIPGKIVITAKRYTFLFRIGTYNT